jgi:hypothetical protein
MEEPPIRTREQRLADTLEYLRSNNHMWIATASGEDPVAHLVPISYAWTGEALVIATGDATKTAVNLVASKRARLALGQTDDVVMIDATLTDVVPIAQAPPDLGRLYADQSDWDPRLGAGEATSFYILTPMRVQAWRENNEIGGRTLMRGGRWLTD